MARRPLAELQDWELEHPEQDLRGEPLLDADGATVGTVEQMIVDTDARRVVAIRLANGAEYSVEDFELRCGIPVLFAAGTARRPTRPAESRDARQEARSIPIVEERLRITKRPVQRGEVEVGKTVVAEEKTVRVPVTREEVHVERRDVDVRHEDARGDRR